MPDAEPVFLCRAVRLGGRVPHGPVSVSGGPNVRPWLVMASGATPSIARLTFPQSISENAFEVPMAMVLTCSILQKRMRHISHFKGIPLDSGSNGDALNQRIVRRQSDNAYQAGGYIVALACPSFGIVLKNASFQYITGTSQAKRVLLLVDGRSRSGQG